MCAYFTRCCWSLNQPTRDLYPTIPVHREIRPIFQINILPCKTVRIFSSHSSVSNQPIILLISVDMNLELMISLIFSSRSQHGAFFNGKLDLPVVVGAPSRRYWCPKKVANRRALGTYPAPLERPHSSHSSLEVLKTGSNEPQGVRQYYSCERRTTFPCIKASKHHAPCLEISRECRM
jgi:hypothetical protein